MTSAPVRVLVVEDHPVVGEGLRALLSEDPRIQVVRRVETVAQAGQAAAEEPLDVALIDFRLPDGTGAEAATRIREHQPDAAVVFLSADDSEPAMIAAVEAGASGYLIKTAETGEILEAVQRAAEGEMLIPAPRLAALLARRRELAQEKDRRARLRASLTPREHEILALMAEGLDNRQIAERLHVAYPTVRSHVRRVLQKLGCRSRLEAVVKAGSDLAREEEE
ncbi:MAG TPA: response regulator transcription factor [Natronosporangium sp.]|nr:response regulator transcription factor [Natronosporangium sp.]